MVKYMCYGQKMDFIYILGNSNCGMDEHKPCIYIYIYHVLTIAYMAITVGHPISVIEFWENTHPSICVSLNFWVNHTTG